MIEGKAGVTGSPDLSGAEAEVETYFGANAPKPALAHPDQSSLLLVRAQAWARWRQSRPPPPPPPRSDRASR